MFTIRTTKSSRNWWKGERRVCGERWAGVHNGLFIVCRAPYLETDPLWPMGDQCWHPVANKRADKSQSQLWTVLFPNLDIDTSRIAIVSAPPRPRPIVLEYLPPILEPIHRKQRSKDWSQAAASELLFVYGSKCCAKFPHLETAENEELGRVESCVFS